MSLFPRQRIDKHCLIPCPPERCNCKAGAPAHERDAFSIEVITDVDYFDEVLTDADYISLTDVQPAVG